MKWLVTILAVGLLATADKGKNDDKDAKALEGNWQTMSVEQGGQKAEGDDVSGGHLVIKGDRYEQVESDKVIEEGGIKLNPTKSPRAIDLTITSGNDQGKTQLGIYKIDGDTLTLCLAKAGNKDRPKEFTADQGSDHLLLVFKRTKK